MKNLKINKIKTRIKNRGLLKIKEKAMIIEEILIVKIKLVDVNHSIGIKRLKIILK
jgi:hypothetical protein